MRAKSRSFQHWRPRDRQSISVMLRPNSSRLRSSMSGVRSLWWRFLAQIAWSFSRSFWTFSASSMSCRISLRSIKSKGFPPSVRLTGWLGPLTTLLWEKNSPGFPRPGFGEYAAGCKTRPRPLGVDAELSSLRSQLERWPAPWNAEHISVGRSLFHWGHSHLFRVSGFVLRIYRKSNNWKTLINSVGYLSKWRGPASFRWDIYLIILIIQNLADTIQDNLFVINY